MIGEEGKDSATREDAEAWGRETGRIGWTERVVGRKGEVCEAE